MCICKQWVPGYRRLWERNSQFLCIASDFACNLQGAKRLLVPALSYGLACLPQLGLLNTTARVASPPLFSSTYFHHIIRVTSALRASCYYPRCLHQPHHHPHRHRTHCVTSYCTTSHCPCECYANNSRSSLIFSPRHICNCPCRRQPHRHPD